MSKESTNAENSTSLGNDAKLPVSGSLPSQELIEILKECRDLLVMCTLIDKSGHCKSLVDKVDTKMGWQ
jgi:hypothetical protein